PQTATAARFTSPEEIARNWPRFRGPGGSGISPWANIPTDWDGPSGRGILWKTLLPLPGESSPVVWGDRVFLTGATETKREVYCFHADTGSLLWRREVRTPKTPTEAPDVFDDTGFAAPTPLVDGQRVYALFANGDLACFDFQGRQVWAMSLGTPDNIYGHASSLAMWKNLLIVQYDQGADADDGLSDITAYDGATGELAWVEGRTVPNSWTTPIVIRHEDRDQIITAANPWVIAYDPADGSEIWRAKCLRQDVGPSPTFADGVVFVANEFPYVTAIQADGSGDVTETHILWQGEDGLPDTASPIATDQFVFLLASYGTLSCYDAKSGEFLWEQDFDESFTSSPSLVGERLYLFGLEGKGWVVKPSREGCEIVAETDLGEECVTSPAFQQGRLYIRGKQ
ncbi:hypothetical protein LCGC14_2846650, partial [marine sediment metagenome]